MLASRNTFLQTGLVPVEDPSTIPEDDECCICTDTHTDPVSLPCSHIFCRKCITDWLSQKSKNTCPTCRRVHFTLDESDKPPVSSDRVVVMGQAMANSGLLGGNYSAFHPNIHITNISDLYRASAQSNVWLAEQNHPLAAGPVRISRHNLGYHLVAMGNLMRGYAQAQGRRYNSRQLRDWRILVNTIYEVISRRDGRTVDGIVLARQLRDEVRSFVVSKGLMHELFFEGEARPSSLAADFDLLLAYIVRKASDDFARQETQRIAIRKSPTLMGKMGAWFRQLVHG